MCCATKLRSATLTCFHFLDMQGDIESLGAEANELQIAGRGGGRVRRAVLLAC
jgi:hypothetical protein